MNCQLLPSGSCLSIHLVTLPLKAISAWRQRRRRHKREKQKQLLVFPCAHFPCCVFLLLWLPAPPSLVAPVLTVNCFHLCLNSPAYPVLSYSCFFFLCRDFVCPWCFGSAVKDLLFIYWTCLSVLHWVPFSRVTGQSEKVSQHVVVKLLPQQWPHCQSVIFKDFHWLLKIFIVLFQMKCTYYVDSLDLLHFLCRISDCVMLFLWEENIYYVSVVHKVDDNHCPVYVSLDPHIHRYFQKNLIQSQKLWLLIFSNQACYFTKNTWKTILLV